MIPQKNNYTDHVNKKKMFLKMTEFAFPFPFPPHSYLKKVPKNKQDCVKIRKNK